MSLPTPTRVRRATGEEGFALLTVLGSMVVVTLFLMSTIAYAMHNSAPSRRDQDAKAALAAAQAGIEEFISRLNADDTYYANTLAHASNPAFTAAGVPVPGTGGGAAFFRYSLLTTAQSTSADGVIRLRVTGTSRGVDRDLTATLTPEGFLKYLYFTDLESLDPVVYGGRRPAQHNGVTSIRYEKQMGPGNGVGTRKWVTQTYYVDGTLVETVCKKYWYAGRQGVVYTTGSYMEVDTPDDSGYPTTVTPRTADGSHRITFNCPEIAFSSDDTVSGPLHSNDALQITGAATFTGLTGTSWGSGQLVPPPTDGKLWWGDKTVTLLGRAPQHVPVVQMPTSNDALRAQADPLDPANTSGCLYTGQTSIRFEGTKMWVLSPGTTSSVPRCYKTSTPGIEQQVDVPSVVYVKGGPCGATDVAFPRRDSTGVVLERLGPETTQYGCGRGTAFVSGDLSGRVTVGTSDDVVITGNIKYQGGLTGADALGLIPQGFAWVYHPVRSDGTNLLTSAQTVRRIDAAILSVSHSFIVQNYRSGAALSTAADVNSKLTVNGSIIQKHRGPVGSSAGAGSGYLKNYVYDTRLNNAPPPFFLRPLASPWSVDKVTD